MDFWVHVKNYKTRQKCTIYVHKHGQSGKDGNYEIKHQRKMQQIKLTEYGEDLRGYLCNISAI